MSMFLLGFQITSCNFSSVVEIFLHSNILFFTDIQGVHTVRQALFYPLGYGDTTVTKMGLAWPSWGPHSSRVLGLGQGGRCRQ